MKKIIQYIIAIIITISLLISYTPTTSFAATNEDDNAPSIVVTEYKSKKSEKYLWKTLNKYSPTEQITAGVMGYFWRESCYRSDAVAGWSSSLSYTGKDPSIKFVKKVDDGLEDGSTRDYFINKVHNTFGGYGLGQWYSIYYLEAFYDFAQEWGTSISDAEMQCAFVMWSLENQQPELWEQIIDMTNAEKVGRLIAVYYDGTSTGTGYIGRRALKMYEKYKDSD